MTAKCICASRAFSGTDDGHAINCPASNQFYRYKAMMGGPAAALASPTGIVSSGVEGVDYAEAARVMFEACRDRFMRAEQCYAAIDALNAAGFIAAPPASSYADGVEDAAKRADAGLAQWDKIVAAGGVTVAGIPITEEEAHVAAGACEALAAAIRLLSQPSVGS